MSFFKEHKKELAYIAAPVAITAGLVVTAPGLVKTAGALVFTGACLAVGFWSGKKLTNAIDAAYYTSDKKIKEVMSDLGMSVPTN
jgi:hypothetical protein